MRQHPASPPSFHRHPPRPSRRLATAVAAALAALAVLTAAPASAGNHNINVGDSIFVPSQLTIQAGDSVTWTKGPSVLPHNVRADDFSFSCANGCSDQGGNGTATAAPWSFTRTFNTAGEFGYHCQVHGSPSGGMRGRITIEAGGGTPGSLRFSNATYSVGEGGGQATITAQRINGDDGAVSVGYATGGGSAGAGDDYTPRSGTLNWADNDDAPKTFTVPILEDTVDEPNETVGLTLSNPTGGAVLGSPFSATLTITDNDNPGPGPAAGNLRFSVANQSAPEEGGPVTVVVERVSGTAGAVSVHYESANGTAAAGGDYTAVSGTLNWAGGNSADKSFQVPILDDGDTEDDETFTVALSAPTGGAGLGAPSTQTLTILDDDVAVPGPCIENDHTLCLLNDRFRVEVVFTPPGGDQQPANAIPFTDRAGMFWFFNANNIEMLVKMQNACIPQFDRYWVFFAATTNVQFRVSVTDTGVDPPRLKRYANPQGMVALPVADTQAFATCP
jgi:plastocyanin